MTDPNERMIRPNSEFFVIAKKPNTNTGITMPRRGTIDFSRRVRSMNTFRDFFAGKSKSLLKYTDGVDPAELAFLHCYYELISRLKIPFVESIPSNLYLADRVSHVKQQKAVSLEDPNPLYSFTGPLIDRGIEHEDIQEYNFEQICAKTISTYPQRGDIRVGDPICDRYGAQIYENRMIFVIADGCNWGERPKVAAERARDVTLAYLSNHITSMRSVQDVQVHLLRSFAEAQTFVCREEEGGPGPGSTTLLAGVLMEIKGESGSPNEWALVCASLGDCKLFIIEHDTLKVRDATADNRAEIKNDTDCGGRLGSVISGCADIRNLRTYCVQCQPGDIVVGVSDGVHDNLHPETLGISPNDIKLDFTDWKEAGKVIDVEEVATKYRVGCLHKLISSIECKPRNIVTKILDHCIDITKNSREWMENNPGKPLSHDYTLFPGKMDHTTCVAFRVGRASSFQEKKEEIESKSNQDLCDLPRSLYSPLCVSLLTTTTSVRICCKTIAKGKFECTAKKKSCTLRVIPVRAHQIGDDEEIIGFSEINEEISRVIKFPKGVLIDIHTKELSICKETGIISIRFERVNK